MFRGCLTTETLVVFPGDTDHSYQTSFFRWLFFYSFLSCCSCACSQWKIPAGLATPQSVIDTFKAWLVKIPSMKTGFIALEHDLFPEEVDVAITGILPLAYAKKPLTMAPIASCLGDAEPYKQGGGTFTS
ncbi:unnamed protein product [Mortierella alpina]